MANKKQKVTIYWNTRHIKLEDIPEVKKEYENGLISPIIPLLMEKQISASLMKIWNCFGKQRREVSFKYVIRLNKNDEVSVYITCRFTVNNRG